MALGVKLEAPNWPFPLRTGRWVVPVMRRAVRVQGPVRYCGTTWRSGVVVPCRRGYAVAYYSEITGVCYNYKHGLALGYP
jgi:hypothetical protein